MAAKLFILPLLGALLHEAPSGVSQKLQCVQGTLSYSDGDATSNNSTLLRTPAAHTYRASLVPDRNVKGDTAVIELVLQRGGKREKHSNDANLLDGPGSLHGMQPYLFVASDLANGAGHSTYGSSRSMNVSNVGLKVRVKVVQAAVKRQQQAIEDPLSCGFKQLVLLVSLCD